MEKINAFFEDYLFNTKNCLVVYGEKANCLETVIALANDFAIQIPDEKIAILNDGVLEIVKRKIYVKFHKFYINNSTNFIHQFNIITKKDWHKTSLIIY